MSIATSRAPIHSNLPEDLRDRLESILENNSLLSRQLRGQTVFNSFLPPCGVLCVFVISFVFCVKVQ